MNDPTIMQMFADVGAIISDSHFVYSSGRHSSVYINKDALYLHTQAIATLCQMMARPFNADQIDVVVGPVLGGIVLSQWVAHFLNANRSSGETLAIYAEKEEDGPDKKFLLRRGYDKYISGRNVLVVEDVLTTGGSACSVIELVRMHGGNVVGLSALCNRGGVQPQDVGDVAIHTLITVTLETFTETACPFCQQHIPINIELGKGRAFLAKQKEL
ncbi:MAG TPA: phosphoribosyltransferase [Ktedonobacter sp.]|jgi:orotate phosphoribosyltransferase|nr:phosphoribosyltransferase [Ktedonobacter sp.]HAG98956.1 phosphoribosyltransferase [Ktedonobacter sp.]HAT46594.1 phosphoribosyltransferase [Ktedonobacter sp.]HBE24469.1 phosphoribosyltransferase [Ktedonobacter sp.]HCF86563.1 phosphoribosyltransferase [Ktedonobacter sp.]